MTSQDPVETGSASLKWPVLDNMLGSVSCVIIAAMALLTCVDIVARYGFDSPVNGAFELTQMLLAGLIFSALPMTTAANEHVDVELLGLAVGERINRLMLTIGTLVSAIVLFALSGSLWAHATRLGHDGAVSNSLNLPFAPIGYFAALSCALSGVIAIARLFSSRSRTR